MAEREVVFCRIEPKHWWVIPLGLAEAVFMTLGPIAVVKSAPPQNAHGAPIWILFALSWSFVAFVLWGIGYLMLMQKRGFIRADANGLQWCGAIKLFRARWDEVTDYYDVALPRSRRRFVIETRGGKLEVIGLWTNPGALRDFVQTHATESQSRIWQVQAKDRSWPQVFHYRGWENRWFMPVITFGGTVGWFLMFGIIFSKELPSVFAESDFIFGAAAVLFSLVVTCGMPWLYSVTFVPTVRDVRRRWNQTITATPEGIFFEDGARRIEALWDEITNFYNAPSAGCGNGIYVVETAYGKFDFRQEIGPYGRLQIIIQEHARQSASREWKMPGAKDIETLGGEKSKWRNDQRVYSYRTRSNRALLWIPSGLWLIFPVIAWLKMQAFLPENESSASNSDAFVPLMVIISVFVGAITVCGWWWFYKFSIRTDEKGLTQTRWRDERFMDWAEITDFYSEGTSLLISTAHERWRINENIADFHELREEVARRTELGESER